MATITNVNRKRTFDSITIELSYEEANALYAVLCRVGGSDRMSRRKYTAAITDLLRAEVDPLNKLANNEDLTGFVCFAIEANL